MFLLLEYRSLCMVESRKNTKLRGMSLVTSLFLSLLGYLNLEGGILRINIADSYVVYN